MTDRLAIYIGRLPEHSQRIIREIVEEEKREARIDELRNLNPSIESLDFKKIDRGNEAYNPAFQDFRMGFTTAKGFCQKFVTNRLSALTHQKQTGGEL